MLLPGLGTTSSNPSQLSGMSPPASPTITAPVPSGSPGTDLELSQSCDHDRGQARMGETLQVQQEVKG